MTDAERSAAQIVVADASLLINLMHVDRLQLMTTGLGYQFVMPQEVDEEIKHPAQRAIVLAACKAGKLQIAELTDLAAITIFGHLTQRFGKGESACLALAESKGWIIATDEGRRFRREIEARIGAHRVLGTIELFLTAIRAQLLSIPEADADKATLETKRFRTKFSSFGELL